MTWPAAPNQGEQCHGPSHPVNAASNHPKLPAIPHSLKKLPEKPKLLVESEAAACYA